MTISTPGNLTAEHLTAMLCPRDEKSNWSDVRKISNGQMTGSHHIRHTFVGILGANI